MSGKGQSSIGSHGLPAGVELLELSENRDDRGAFTEVFRQYWTESIVPVQWNVVRSRARVLRGVHVHVRHADYLVLVEGRASIALVDLRNGSATRGMSVLLTVASQDPQALVIPPGVAHGFLFHEPSIHFYAVSHYWDVEDELGCRWDDPGLELDWPEPDPILSQRDKELPSLDELRTNLSRVL